jgi:hypothetical protein
MPILIKLIIISLVLGLVSTHTFNGRENNKYIYLRVGFIFLTLSDSFNIVVKFIPSFGTLYYRLFFIFIYRLSQYIAIKGAIYYQ